MSLVPFSNLSLLQIQTDQRCSAAIETSIRDGETVVIDRYYYSGCVYSAAKNNPTLSLTWARHPEVGLPRPDVCLFLDISAQQAAERGGFGGERYEISAMQTRVRELFNEIRTAGTEKDDFVTIDAGRSVEDVAEDVVKVVLEVTKKIGRDSLPLRTVEP